MIEGLMTNITESLLLAEESIAQFRRQNFCAGLGKVIELSKALASVTEKLVGANTYFQQWGYDVDVQNIFVVLTGVISAQEQGDYILVADLLELQLIPVLLQIQEILTANGVSMVEENLLAANLKGFIAKDEPLAKRIADYVPEGYCTTEPTSSGLLTMKVSDETGEYYFHSNVNPVVEGRRFAEEYYSLEHSHYVVFGLGLGYHIKEMLKLDDGIFIDIVEQDIEIMKTAFSVMDMEWIYNNPRIRLIWDDTCSEWTKLLAKDKAFVIHYPSLRHIADKEKKLQLEKFFILDSGWRNMRIQLENNFRDNLANCEAYVDVLEAEFRGKNAVIVAAGPSLDKNVEQLRNKPENTIVIAVGTVFRKLVGLGIKPDYVVFLDAQPRLYRQLEGLEEQDIPILCGATVCKQIPAAYQGPKYLVCQHGFDRAECYAKEHGYRQYETGGSVSTIALDICLQLGCKSVAYVGLDLAFTGNHTHAKGTMDYAAEDEKEKIMVKALAGGMVAASHLFIIYREWIERRVAAEQGRVEIIDATEGGALKKGLAVKTLHETFLLWEKDALEKL